MFDWKIEGCSWKIIDYCCYVDDMRIVVKFIGRRVKGFCDQIVEVINDCLEKYVFELDFNLDKISVIYGGLYEVSLLVVDVMQLVI